MARSPEVQELIRRMQVSNEACESQFIDLTEYRFKSDDSSMWLENAKGLMGSEKYSFRMDPARPKDLDINLGITQFCKILKIPGAFFRDNRPQLRETFVRNWIAALTPGDPKSMFQVRMRRGSEHVSIRAILPALVVDLPHYRALGAMLPDTADVPVDLLGSDGDTQDCRTMEASFLIGNEFLIRGQAFRLGIQVWMSELGCGDLEVEAFVHHVAEGWDMIVSFSHDPLLVQPYRGIQPKDFEALLRELVPDLLSRIPSIQEASVSLSDDEFPGLESCLNIVARKLPRDMESRIRREVEVSGTEFGEEGQDKVLEGTDHPLWGFMNFARGVSLIARDTQGTKKIALERAAGLLLQLNLKKK